MILLNQLKICIGYILYPYGMFNIFSLFLSYIFIFSHFIILFCFPKQNLTKCVTCFFFTLIKAIVNYWKFIIWNGTEALNVFYLIIAWFERIIPVSPPPFFFNMNMFWNVCIKTNLNNLHVDILSFINDVLK